MIDVEKCTGCNLCVIACSLQNEKVVNALYSRIHIIRRNGAYIPIICLQCEKAVCEIICPVAAIERDKETGALTINYDRCIGCKLCMTFCPLGAISWSKRGNVTKCDYCKGDPICVKVCTAGALRYADVAKLHMMKRIKVAENYYEVIKKLTGVTT